MHTSQWNNGWLFWQEKDAFALVWSIPAEAKPVILPHDAMLENPARAEKPLPKPATSPSRLSATARLTASRQERELERLKSAWVESMQTCKKILRF